MNKAKISVLLIVFFLASITFTPALASNEGCAGGSWQINYTLEFPAGYWVEGSHENILKTTDPSGTFINSHDFTSSSSAPLYPGQLRIGFFGISSIEQQGLTTINPAQDTYMQVTFGASSRADAIALRDNMTVQFSWDGGDWVDVAAGPIYCFHPNNGVQIATHMRTWGYAE